MNNEENENIIDTTNVDTNEDLVTHEEIVDDNIKINNDSTDDFSGVFHERDSRDVNNIVTEVKDSFLRYSMSVITSRALPDLRDGLKPVHRRILWSMYEEGNTPDKPHRKSATTVGNVMGHYHPHGDSSIYEAMVRLAQDFSQRYILVDGHGNFGNIDGDGAAAYRYTEARLSKLSLELLRDINKDTVDFMPNFDATLKEPKVLPSKFPNVLVNGSMGIAVGMATNIPPHNLGEVIDGCVAYIDNPDIDTLGLMQYIKGPDFPTGGIILGNSGIKQAYETGRGTLTIRSRAEIEEKGTHSNIVITEVPYGINTSELKNKVAELVHNKIIDGITDYHTDLKNGVKITITLKKDANAQVVLNKLFKHTQFQVNYSIIFLMLDQGVPRTLGLKSIISKYIDHQKEVIIRRTKFDLKKSEARVHILEGYKIALDNIDEVIKVIKTSETDEIAKKTLMDRFFLSQIQAESILELKLRRLTGLERSKIEEELKSLLELIEELKSILASEEKVLNIIKQELLDIKNRYSDDRRTSIDMTAIDYIEDESLIPNENIVISLTSKGYIKRTTSETYKIQNRGGVGVKGMSTNEEDYVEYMSNLMSHDYVLLFTNKGKVYKIKGYEVPEFSRTSKGLPIINLLQIDKDEYVTSMLTYSRTDSAKYLLFATKNGIIKKTSLTEYNSARKTGLLSITLKEDDELIDVRLTDGEDNVVLVTKGGMSITFDEKDVRPMGRVSQGVIGIRLGKDDEVIGMESIIAGANATLLAITENGFGKRTELDEYRVQTRGGKGVITYKVTPKTGNIVGIRIVEEADDVMLITDTGTIIRLNVAGISVLGRSTQGVTLMRTNEGRVVSIEKITEKEEENG